MLTLIRKLTTFILPIFVALLLAATSPLYFLTQKITDREHVRGWFKNPVVTEKYREYLVDQIVKENNLNFLGIVIDTKEIRGLVEEQITDEWVEVSIDTTIDATYDWLEGKTDTPTLDLSSSESALNDSVAKSLDEKFGLLSGLVNFQKMDFVNGTIPLLNFNDKIMELIPQTYAQLKLLPQRVVILNVVLIAIMLFTSKDLRNATLRLGLTGLLFGATILYAPTFLKDNPQVLQALGINLEVLPKPDQYPVFAQEIFTPALDEIRSDINPFVWGGFIGGIVLTVLSQLELKEVEVWDNKHPKDDPEEDDEEDEE